MSQIQLRTINAGTALVAGCVLGLLVGLLIGWVIWPVEWQGAALNELLPEAKAEYLAAVADSYTMYGSPEAAETARRRLAALDGDLTGEFEAAIAHFSASNDPDKAVRISNLSSLAAALGVTLPNLVGATQPDTAAAQTASEASDAPPAAGQPTGGIGWLRWLSGALLAVVLVLGGAYLLLRLSRREPESMTEVQEGAFIDNQIAALRGNDSVAADSVSRYVAGDQATRYDGEELATANRAVAASQLLAEEPEEYSFDDDPEDYTTMPTLPRGDSGGRAGHYTQFTLEDHTDEEESDGETADEDWERALHAPLPDPARRESPPVQVTNASQSNSATAQPAGTARPAAVTRGTARYKLLEVYTAHYQAGIHDYDESHPITDSHSARYIGECGMGVSTKNGLLQNNPDQVVALEVWLFDKTDEKNLGSQTRVLLSEYAVDHNLDQVFLRERQDDPRPFTAQPNVRFQLESQNLLLDCTIVEALYNPSGPGKGTFQSVKVEMAIHKKV
ncbi:MAG: hypothetical protein DCC55_08020 [Chloroflexi bacterium]|nr:MAG: hypothetical protein DCC55_08020 [Chloroflexota bacterium]